MDASQATRKKSIYHVQVTVEDKAQRRRQGRSSQSQTRGPWIQPEGWVRLRRDLFSGRAVGHRVRCVGDCKRIEDGSPPNGCEECLSEREFGERDLHAPAGRIRAKQELGVPTQPIVVWPKAGFPNLQFKIPQVCRRIGIQEKPRLSVPLRQGILVQRSHPGVVRR